MSSGISDLSGRLIYFPAICVSSHSSHASLERRFDVTESMIVSSDFDFSRTPIISPGRRMIRGYVNHVTVDGDMTV